MIKGSKNKGDWGEFYVLVYLLGTRKLVAADQYLNPIPSMYFPIKKIFREEETDKKIEFSLSDINSVVVYVNGKKVNELSCSDFIREAKMLLIDIPKGNNSFDIPHGESFLNSLQCFKLSASSDDITDIRMLVHDVRTSVEQIMGFSIKSYFGGAPTLLNASSATNFVYEIKNLPFEQIQKINSIGTKSKIQDRISAILSAGGELIFKRTLSKVFENNLVLIDTIMDRILAEMLLYSYSKNIVDCQCIINAIESANPCKYERTGIYEHKFKEFLCAKALGLNPSEPWNGTDDANGGYIVAKSNGDVLAFHIYNRDKFKEYLLKNTRFERGSTSRHKYAEIYEDSGKLYINLNMQIRFKSLNELMAIKEPEYFESVADNTHLKTDYSDIVS